MMVNQEKRRTTKEDVEELREMAADIEIKIVDLQESVWDFYDFLHQFTLKDPIPDKVLSELRGDNTRRMIGEIESRFNYIRRFLGRALQKSK
jgi:hypothetical protein